MEIAPFAARALNILESLGHRGARAPQGARRRGAADDDSYRGLARGYYELGVLRATGPYGACYLGESLGWYGKVSRLEEADTTTLFRAYVELGRPGEAGAEPRLAGPLRVPRPARTWSSARSSTPSSSGTSSGSGELLLPLEARRATLSHALS